MNIRRSQWVILAAGLAAWILTGYLYPFPGPDSPLAQLLDQHYPAWLAILRILYYALPGLGFAILVLAAWLIARYCHSPAAARPSLLSRARDHLPSRPQAAKAVRTFVLLLACALGGSYLWSSHFPFPDDLISPRYPALRAGVEAAYFAAPGVGLALALFFAASGFLRTNLGGRVGRLLLRCVRFPIQFVKPWPAILLAAAAAVTAANWHYRPFPGPGSDPLADLLAYHDPALSAIVTVWYYAAPGAALILLSAFSLSVVRVWFQAGPASRPASGRLPPWPVSPDDPCPSIAVGEIHHPIEPRESDRPSWLVIPEKGLYTGIAVFGAVGTGKTTACMHPFAEQILSWAADDPRRRAAALVLEVKGDFCHSVQKMLREAGRGDDYREIGLDGTWQWNPLDDPLLDSYSLAYTISSLLNQLFGKGKEPFWQQAYTNLVRWIIELHRLLPANWVTLQDVFRCTIDEDLLQQKVQEAEAEVNKASSWSIVIPKERFSQYKKELGLQWSWTKTPGGKWEAPFDSKLEELLKKLEIKRELVRDTGAVSDLAARVDAVARLYRNDWLNLEDKLRSSIVEGVSVFLSLFDDPKVASVFCPPPPPAEDPKPTQPELGQEEAQSTSGGTLNLKRRLPPLADLIESGKVLALNMPAGANPALARAIGVLLKNAWLQALLRRPAQIKQHPGRYFRPAAFICDEYQSFATVGEDDPSGDEKSFALTRQCRCIPIVATQSISSLRSAIHGGEAWRTLIQTLRTRIFLSLSDEASARIASDMCGSVGRMKPSYSFSENVARGGVSLLSGRPGGGRGSVGASKSFREQREPVFHPRDFTLLANYQAICLPYDGTVSLSARRVYLKPHYLDRETGYWRQRERGEL
ncbi:MAG: type IV secretion system DNA-binding domain-containing protein [Acidobacteria bacterium]|nr:type IV secretion system DNA-binding domain-containing protein [Acidobacteriota bacterium]